VHPERLPLLGPHRLRRGLCRRALSNDEGRPDVPDLGDKDILFLRNHGVLVTGPTVAKA
jgi:ribulose-5-phosphate 4-epimerase/fuculose-1-phosphate aldolase